MVCFLGKGNTFTGASCKNCNGHKKRNQSWFTKFKFGREKENSPTTTRREV